MRVANLKANLKLFLKEYVIAPSLWRRIATIIGRLRRLPSYTSKQKYQYPYCWAGEDYEPARGGEYLTEVSGKNLVMVTRNRETKAAVKLGASQAFSITNLPENVSAVTLAVTSAEQHVSCANFSIAVNGKQLCTVKGELARESWQHITLPIDGSLNQIDLQLKWSGGDLCISDPGVERVQQPAAADKKPNIVVLVLDSMMATSVGCLNGQDRLESHTPHIDKFFEDGSLFSNAYSISEYTMPSLATMATGLYPIQHGVFTHDKNQRELPFAVPTLAETLKQAGYKTLGYSTGARFSPLYAHYRGYDRFFSHNMSYENTSDLLVDRTIEFMEVHADRPSFCFLHLIDPHPPFSLPTYYSDHAADQVRWGDSRSLYGAFKLHRDSSDLIQDLRAVERSMIKNTDFIISKLFAWIKQLESDRDTIVVLLADHGREYKKGSPLLTKSLTHIPLLIAGPGVAKKHRSDLVQPTLDLYPTILQAAGLSLPDHVAGQNVLNETFQRDHVISESLFRRTGEFVLRNDDWMYAVRADFEYMSGVFDFSALEGEWLFPRDPQTGLEKGSQNLAEQNVKLTAEYRGKARTHYNDLPRYFDNSQVLEFSHDYAE